ncbi:MAG: GFA family protein [Gammaproteobacteria bacterium]|nr:GFA family protein [Gammaproteobacteria bacterium]
MTTHSGGCHCGDVRFEVDAPADLDVSYCNCSICRMSGYLHLIVREQAFRLLTAENALSTYSFNTGVARHYFCRRCGIKSFYIPRSNPDGVSVNARCIDPGTVRSISVSDFDGENWEANADSLRHLTA